MSFHLKRFYRLFVMLLVDVAASMVPPLVAQQIAVPDDKGEEISNPGAEKPTAKPWSGPWTHGTITIGYTYLWADQGGGERINLNGWFAKPAINIAHGWSAFADFTNYYGENRKGPLNSHGFTFGGQKSFFNQKRVKPGLFAEAGLLRTSNGTIGDSFLFNAGGNLSIPMYKHLALALTPAEYIMIKPPNGQPIRNDFNAKVGFSFPF